MQDHTKTKLAEIHNEADRALCKAYQAGEDDTYRWFADKLQELNLEKEKLVQLMMLFVVERKGYPAREELIKHYEASLLNLMRKSG